jgi:hypothetical protein
LRASISSTFYLTVVNASLDPADPGYVVESRNTSYAVTNYMIAFFQIEKSTYAILNASANTTDFESKYAAAHGGAPANVTLAIGQQILSYDVLHGENNAVDVKNSSMGTVTPDAYVVILAGIMVVANCPMNFYGDNTTTGSFVAWNATSTDPVEAINTLPTWALLNGTCDAISIDVLGMTHDVGQQGSVSPPVEYRSPGSFAIDLTVNGIPRTMLPGATTGGGT